MKLRVFSALMTVWVVLLTACSGNTATPGTASPTADASAQPSAETAADYKLVTEGKLTYGVAATYPPFEYMADEQYTGFDIEFMEAIARELGLEVEIVAMNFDGLIPALQGKRIDLINSAMFVTEARAAQVDFIKYMGIGRSIVVPKGNKLGIASMNDLSGKTVAVTRGAIEEVYVTEFNAELKAEGKTEIDILALPTANDAVLATENGRAEAFLHSSPGAAYLLKEREGVFEIAQTMESGTQIGIAVNKGETALAGAIEEAVKTLVEKGIYHQLMAKYNLPAEMSLFNR
ncbi:ABC transporter substrate-binding protein [Paenibacillus oryzae]|uniref:ABC transporter substrate-binding protein n=1 Tax=Paenibacillus oryzae TaxID=1844972 RepID=UPI0009ED86E0|nr:ABC transporter substrate-binding protein [Paenibacillus oryzae]